MPVTFLLSFFPFSLSLSVFLVPSSSLWEERRSSGKRGRSFFLLPAFCLYPEKEGKAVRCESALSSFVFIPFLSLNKRKREIIIPSHSSQWKGGKDGKRLSFFFFLLPVLFKEKRNTSSFFCVVPLCLFLFSSAGFKKGGHSFSLLLSFLLRKALPFFFFSLKEKAERGNEDSSLSFCRKGETFFLFGKWKGTQVMTEERENAARKKASFLFAFLSNCKRRDSVLFSFSFFRKERQSGWNEDR